MVTNKSSVSFQLILNSSGSQHDHGENRLQRVHDHRADQLPHRGEIVGRAGHQIAGAMLLEKRQRLIDQVGVKVLAQVVFNMTRDAIDDAALQEKKETAHSAETQDLERGNRQLGPGYLGPIGINCPAHNQRNAEIEEYITQDAGDRDGSARAGTAENSGLICADHS